MSREKSQDDAQPRAGTAAPPIVFRSARPRYPLSVLFVLMTICAVIAGMDATVLSKRAGGQDPPGLEEVVAAAALGMLLGGVVGVSVGISHYRRLQGALLALPLGIVVGIVVCPLLYVPLNAYPAFYLVACVGFAMLVGAGIFVRLSKGS